MPPALFSHKKHRERKILTSSPHSLRIQDVGRRLAQQVAANPETKFEDEWRLSGRMFKERHAEESLFAIVMDRVAIKKHAMEKSKRKWTNLLNVSKNPIPEKIVADGIGLGRTLAWVEQTVLTAQPYIWDENQTETVHDVIQRLSQEVEAPVIIHKFHRLAL